MSYLDSDKIKIFPFSTTRSTDPEGRWLSEKNLTNIIKELTDYHSYVISYDDQGSIRFVINGYLVEAMLPSALRRNVYAVIQITDNVLSGGDNTTNQFTCVNFSKTVVETNINDGIYALHLLDEEGHVPETSYRRFHMRAMNISKISCGDSKE